jgi:DNA-binding NtrC family response regulator
VPNLLLVDDDDRLRAMMADTLQELGWSVTTARSADEARQILELGSAFHTMITDVRMPGKLDGIALARLAQHTYKAMKIVVISGYLGRDTNPIVSDGLGRFLAKPFTMARLAAELEAG